MEEKKKEEFELDPNPTRVAFTLGYIDYRVTRVTLVYQARMCGCREVRTQ